MKKMRGFLLRLFLILVPIPSAYVVIAIIQFFDVIVVLSSACLKNVVILQRPFLGNLGSCRVLIEYYKLSEENSLGSISVKPYFKKKNLF